MDTIQHPIEGEKYEVWLAPTEDQPFPRQSGVGAADYEQAKRYAEGLVLSDLAVLVPVNGGQRATAREVLLRIAAVQAFFRR